MYFSILCVFFFFNLQWKHLMVNQKKNAQNKNKNSNSTKPDTNSFYFLLLFTGTTYANERHKFSSTGK